MATNRNLLVALLLIVAALAAVYITRVVLPRMGPVGFRNQSAEVLTVEWTPPGGVPVAKALQPGEKVTIDFASGGVVRAWPGTGTPADPASWVLDSAAGEISLRTDAQSVTIGGEITAREAP